jgi:hypothetical protein
MKQRAFWFAVGFVSLLVLKYALIGVKSWDKAFHPKRSQGEPTFI